eukprot:TRINITY_DN59728_c0_g1_i1.p2 TRINITY_DN59728_c0_g1~~TRINITY_DN59728_c0_g1_i1.p2  ORF type:complete len:161 (-),score=27.68 TRINITY_DN59728_c0_g1_i1:26-463(-)
MAASNQNAESTIHQWENHQARDPIYVMEEHIDSNYKPSKEELEEYIHWLGGKLPEDEGLLWIAREALVSPLPPCWRPCQSGESSDIFYFNIETGESMWEHPCDAKYRELFVEKKREIKEKKQKKRQQEQASRSTDTRRTVWEEPN